MRTMIFVAAVAVALSAAARPGNDGPFKTSQWTDGQYSQQINGPVNIFPNPAADQVNITYPGLTGEATVTLVAEDGRVIRSVQVGQTDATRSVMDINDLPNGLYIIRVEQADGLNISRRLMVANAAQSTSP